MANDNATIRKYLTRGQVCEVYIVTQWRDGCVYRTKSVGYIIARSDYDIDPKLGRIGAPSTRLYKEYLND